MTSLTMPELPNRLHRLLAAASSDDRSMTPSLSRSAWLRPISPRVARRSTLSAMNSFTMEAEPKRRRAFAPLSL
jgi:hypothetical protein